MTQKKDQILFSLHPAFNACKCASAVKNERFDVNVTILLSFRGAIHNVPITRRVLA